MKKEMSGGEVFMWFMVGMAMMSALISTAELLVK